MAWTDEQVEQLRTLWAEGHSTAEIGRRMGLEKNAVVGKAHRLGLASRASPILYQNNAARNEDILASVARGIAQVDIARRLKLSPDTVSNVVKRARNAGWDPGQSGKATLPQLPSLAPQSIMRPFQPGTRLPPVPPPATRPAQRAPVPSWVSGVSRCLWPIGEPRTRGYRTCDAPADLGMPYCHEHCHVAYVGYRPRVPMEMTHGR